MTKILRIKAERIKRNWSQVDLAFHARMTPSDISRIETRRMVPYPAHAERLARVLGIGTAELLEDVGLAQSENY